MDDNREPLILHLDIETTPNLGYTWGKYEQTVIEYVRESSLLGITYQWVHEGKTKSFMLCDSKKYKRGGLDDYEVALMARDLLDKADIVIAHNGDAFDIRKLNARFAFHGLTPPSFYKTIDTKKAAKKYFKFNSNKLDDLGIFFNLGRKVKHDGFEMWLGCMNGDEKHWRNMRKYAVQDVDLLVKIYEKLRPWMESHPNLNVFGSTSACSKCLGKLQRRGWAATTSGRKQRYQCTKCGGWSSGTVEKVTNIK